MVGGVGFTASSPYYLLSPPMLEWQTTRSGVLYMDNKIKGFQNTFPPAPEFQCWGEFLRGPAEVQNKSKGYIGFSTSFTTLTLGVGGSRHHTHCTAL